MKIKHTITLASVLLLAAGCAHEEHQASYDESISPYAADGTSRYEHQQNNISLDAGGSTDHSSVAAGASASGSAGATASVSDNTLVTQVRESLQRDPEIAPIAPNVQISANNGTIVLSGSVQSEAQKRQIKAIAGRAAGVVAVNDLLQAPSENGMEQGNASNNGEKEGAKTGETMAPTSRSDAGNSLYSTNNLSNPGSDQSVNPASNGGQLLNPTSATSNSEPQIYQDNGNGASNPKGNELNPTSRTNAQNHIYQESNPGQSTQDQNQNQNQNTNSNSQMP